MKIVICGSMSSAKLVVSAADELIEFGHEVIVPKDVKKYARGVLPMETQKESIENKIKDDLLKRYFQKIKNSDAVLIINTDKNGIKNYIGGNTFLEMAFAHVLEKKIFLYNEIPQMSYTDEIIAMQPIVINQDLRKIK